MDASLNPKEEDVISAKAECEAASLEVAEAYKLVECNCKDDFGLDLMCGDEPFIVTVSGHARSRFACVRFSFVCVCVLIIFVHTVRQPWKAMG